MAQLPAPDYDSLVTADPHTVASLTTDGWTETGTVEDTNGGITFDHATADGMYVPQAEANFLLLVDCKLESLFNSGSGIRAICGLHPANSPANFEWIGIGRNGTSSDTGHCAADGSFSFGPGIDDHLYDSVGDVFRCVINAQMGGTPRYAQCFITGKNGTWERPDNNLSATTRANIFLGSGDTGLGVAGNLAAPVTITRIRRWNLTPTTLQLEEAIHGEVVTFIPGNSLTVTTAPVLTFNAKTGTTITLDIAHAANADGAIIHFRDNRAGSPDQLYVNNPVLNTTPNFQITGLVANETYKIIARPYGTIGGDGLFSNEWVEPLADSGHSY